MTFQPDYFHMVDVLHNKRPARLPIYEYLIHLTSEVYPWVDIPHLYWKDAAPKFDALSQSMLLGMTAVGGAANEVVELSQDLVCFEHLAMIKAAKRIREPELP